MRRPAVFLPCVLTILLAVSLCASPAPAQSLAWEWTGGPEGAAITCILVTPAGTLLVGTDDGGLFRSTDGGASWASTEDGLTWPCCNYTIQSLAAVNTVVYAGTWGGGVYRSTDDGASWSAAEAIPEEGYPIIDAIAVCRFGQRVYVGGNFGVARSDDGGDSWTLIRDGLSSGWVRDLALRGTTLYALLDSGIYRLPDDGTTWEAWNDGLTATSGQQSLRATGDALFLATHAGGVYHLDCGDSTWVLMSDGLVDNYVDAVVDVDQGLYAGNMGAGAARWNPVTLLWESVNTGLWFRDIRQMARRGLAPWAGTFGAGMFEFDPDAETWTERNSGLTAAATQALVVDGSNVIAGAYGGGISRSADLGETWEFSNTGLDELTVLTLTMSGTNIYAGTWNGVWKSTDHGASWESAGLGGHGIFALSEVSGVLTAGTWDGQVYTSLTGGDPWTAVGTGLPGGAVSSVVRLGSARYAAVRNNGVYVLPDAGTTWTAMNAGLPSLTPLVLAVNQDSLFVGMDGQGVYRWSGSAAEWQLAGEDLQYETIFCLLSNGIQLLAGSWGHLNGTIDGGQTWTDEHNGLKDWLSVRALAAGSGYLFAGLAGGGVWRSGSAGGVGELDPVSPPGLSLQVHPNPFSPVARIAFTLDRPADTRISVFDVAGRVVAEIPGGLLPAGSYERAWDGTDARGQRAADGLYLIHLRAGERELTSKVIRMR